MAEQLLNHAQVRAVLQQMRRETVPQHVRRDVALDARELHALLDVLPHRLAGKLRSALREKDIRR
jgi:hypothetical protein